MPLMEQELIKGSNKQIDSTMTIKCLQLVQTIINYFPGTFSKDQLQMITSLVHLPA